MADVLPEGQTQASVGRQICEEAGRVLLQALWGTGASMPNMGAGSAQFSPNRLGMTPREQETALKSIGISGAQAGDIVADWLHL